MVVCEDGLLDIQSLLAQADEALYCAKERGRNRIEIASLGLVLERAEEAKVVVPDANEMVTYITTDPRRKAATAA
jgi:hypothetical protein